MQRFLSHGFDRSLQRVLSFVLLICVSEIVVSCTTSKPDNTPSVSPSSSPQASISPQADALALEVAVIPWQSPGEQEKKMQPLAEYLKAILKRPVHFQITKDYVAAVDLLAEEKVDMGYLAALTYIKAHDRNNKLQPLVLPIDEITGRPWYSSVIVADTSKGIQTLEDLKGKRFAFVSPSSTSGFLMPLNIFQAKDIDPTRDFSRIVYPGSHDKAEAALAKGEIDAIADDKASFIRAQAAGTLPAQYKVIWESDPIPTGPIVINTSKFTPEEVTKLQHALINAPTGVVDVGGTKSAGYTLAKDADFEAIRQIYIRLKSIKITEK